MPEVLVPAGSFLLPLAELAISLALLFTVSAWWGALGALALLLAFIVGIGISVARGEAPDCHCFGQIHSEPAGWSTILRNVAFLFLAGFVAWQGPGRVGPSTTHWMSRLTGGERVTLGTGLVLLVAVAMLGWFVFNVLRQMGGLVVRMESLESTIVSVVMHGAERPPDSTPVIRPVAPAFALSGLYGETVTLAYLLAPGKPLLLLFASSDCGPCTVALTKAGRWQAENNAHLTVVPIIQGTLEGVQSKATQLRLNTVLIQDSDVVESYGAYTMPSGVVVNADGTIGSSVAEGPDAISALLDATLDAFLKARSPAAAPVDSGAPVLLSEATEPPKQGPARDNVQVPAVTSRAETSLSAPARNGHMESQSDLALGETSPAFVPSANGQQENVVDAQRLVSDHGELEQLATNAVGDLDPSERAETADLDLLKVVTESEEYRGIVPRVSNPHPIETWQEDGLHFFVFQLSTGQGEIKESDAPTAVFVMRSGAHQPVSAVVVTPNGSTNPDVESLRQGEDGMAPVPGFDAVVNPLEPATAGITSSATDDTSYELTEDFRLAPPFALPRLDGRITSLDELRVPGRPVLLLFASAGCGPCTLALTEAGRWQMEHRTQIAVVPMIQGSLEAVQVKAQQLGLTDVLIQDSEVAGAYGATMPSGVLVNPDGTLGSEIAAGPDAIRTLFDGTLAVISSGATPESSSQPTESLPDPEVNTQPSTPDVLSDLVTEQATPSPEEVAAAETRQNGHLETASNLPTDGSNPTKFLIENGTDHISPSADTELLAPLKLSSAYRTLQDMGSQPSLVDSWQENELHFFVFDLAVEDGTDSASESPTAVFIMLSGIDVPLSAVLVASSASPEQEIIDLQQPEQLSKLSSVVA